MGEVSFLFKHLKTFPMQLILIALSNQITSKRNSTSTNIRYCMCILYQMEPWWYNWAYINVCTCCSAGRRGLSSHAWIGPFYIIKPPPVKWLSWSVCGCIETNQTVTLSQRDLHHMFFRPDSPIVWHEAAKGSFTRPEWLCLRSCLPVASISPPNTQFLNTSCSIFTLSQTSI